MASVLKKAVFNLIDKVITQEGQVLNVRKWNPDSMYEIDLHLPATDMAGWKTIPRLKIKVADFEYRDYTPATWDVQKATCTIYIETDHQGFGSAWAKQLKPGDRVLFAPAHAAPLPSKAGKILCLGDGSALGHFMALKQLTATQGYPLDAVLFLNEDYKLPDSLTGANPEFEYLKRPHNNSLESLQQHAREIKLSAYSSIYLAGYIPMVQGLRKLLKTDPAIEAKIFSHGFWS